MDIRTFIFLFFQFYVSDLDHVFFPKSGF